MKWLSKLRRNISSSDLWCPKEADILISGSAKVFPDRVANDGRGQHLACFVAGMVGIASKIFVRPGELITARKLDDGCILAYKAMPSGIMPETFQAIVCGNTTSCPYDEKVLHPPTSYFELDIPGKQKLETEHRLTQTRTRI